MPRQLFRQEAIDAQREKYLGEATIARPVPFWVFTILAAGSALLLIGVALWGEYQRRERADGFLALDEGAARVLISDAGRVTDLLIKEGDEIAKDAPMARISIVAFLDEGAARVLISDAGRVTDLLIKEGDEIAKDAPMARISIERTASVSGASTSEAVTREMESRRASLEREQQQLRDLGEQQVEQSRRRQKDLEAELGQIDREMVLVQARAKSAREQADKYKALGGNQFFSDAAVKQKQDEVTDQEIKLQALRRQKTQVQRDLSAAKLEEPSISIRSRNQVDAVARQMSELQEGMANVEARRETVIRAPVTGVVTNVAVTRGQSVAQDTTFATVLPKGSGLHVELLVPTRAIGFVQKGHEVILRYEAFPHERFGQYRGTITDVSRNVWSPGDRIGPLSAKEPVYRVDVKLESQNVSALGQQFPLRPGMLVNADLLLEKRTLLEWIFEPVLQLKGRL